MTQAANTASFSPPTWSTGNRPSSPILGQMGYNTTTGVVEIYNNSGTWSGVGSGGTTYTNSNVAAYLPTYNGALAVSTLNVSSTTAGSYNAGSIVSGGGAYFGSTVYVTGSIYATGDVYSSYSDINLKTVLAPISNASATLSSIDTFYYEPNQLALTLGVAPGKQIGLNAQQIQQNWPEVVGPSAVQGYLTLLYERLVPVLISAHNEHTETIAELRAEIAELKNQLKDPR